MRFLRTNTAVIITVGPFYDKTDGVTIETALTITNERITLTADTDAGSAPTNVLDNVTGATAGTSNDLNYITGNDAGLMQLELSAADTNRLGRMFLSITDAANHVPVFHEFMVMPALVYDTFFASSGGATFPAATLASTTNITAAAGCAVSSLGANVITAGSINAAALDGKGNWNIGKTGYALSAAGVQAVWDALTSAFTTVGSIGKKLADWIIGTAQTGDAFARLGAPVGASVSADIAAVKAQTAAIETDTAEIGTAGAGLTAINLPDQTMNITGDITGNLSGSVGSVTGITSSDVGAIKTKTDSLTFTQTGHVDANVQKVNDVTIVGDGAATPFNV